MDFVSGVPLIIITFGFQLFNLLFLHDVLRVYSLLFAIVVILSFTGPIIDIVFLANRLLIKKYRTDALKFLVRETLDDNISEGRISKYGYQDYEREAERFRGVKRKAGESPVDFLKTYLRFLGVEVPAVSSLDPL